ncbi:ferritin-like domain-containing protein [Sphaerochaeta sp. PS]|uniref:ferritin-like domain-containing protein n=1 Tax=Sphaerochaeta sp. PS TaxID=3076336 RepID=UPI0028A4CDA7|nr:ferritin-like domain-containing protein [Sphaerochaeta sp. PS]MDT4761934.1 ferritin-like domain-containing protein [Sphaerochaeta sp. PS]
MAYSEPYDALDEKTRDISRAITSLREELEAIDWYNQRVSTTQDQELKDVMAHNRDEEIEHAVMAFEWLRRNMEGFDEDMRTYLFSEGSLLEVEDKATAAVAPKGPASTMTIGNLKN